MPKPREFPDNAALFAALRAGQVNAAWTTTATPNIPSELMVLSDKTSLIRAENLVPLYRRNELNEQQVLALNEVAGVLDTAALADMRRQVAEGRSREWWRMRGSTPTRWAASALLLYSLLTAKLVDGDRL